MTKLTSQNAKLDTANCLRCGRRKRLSKLVIVHGRWYCKRCAVAVENENPTL
jgi:late competence protein required for DNA uptake (superfamily II DNA/RNA helicase)